MQFGKPVLLTALIGAIVSGAAAASSNLPEAVEQAIMHNPEVMARYHALRAAENEQGAAKGNWLPRLDAQAFAGQEKRSYPSQKTDWYDHPGASLELRQLLFDGFATSSDVKRLGYTKLARYYDLLGTSDDIALAAAQAYADMVRYRRLEELARDNWATHREVFSQIEDRVKAGVGRRVDLEQAAGRLALAQSNWLTETSNLHDVTERYRRIVGQMPANTLAALPDVAAALPKSVNPVAEAVSANPAFRASVASVRAARAETDLRRASYMPSVELRVGQNWDRNLDGAPGNYSSTQAQVVLNYNLFRGGSDQARVKQSAELYYAAVDIRDKTCRDVAQQTGIALNDVRALREQITYLEQHALSTQKARDAYRQQFDIGQRTLLDLLDTENELFEARRSLVRTQTDALVAEYRLLAQAHRILPALNLAPMAKQAPDEDRRDGEAEDAAMTCAAHVVVARPLDLTAAMANRPPRTPSPAPADAKPAAPNDAEIELPVRAWAKAWASKDVAAYSAFYSSAFTPENGRSIEHWKSFRNKYVAKNGPISLDIGQISVRRVDKDTAEATFPQDYRSDDYKDKVLKTLVFKREGNAWKIVREYANPPTHY
ncbi:hypothetical protein GCM10025771_15540 [Niveibacterium umoris]|uniref:Adhesin transport system outer membrane protein n=1 Tax=Niveibacterium umoris TaxID=1193620 RepID=A0A840BLY7_9RHOO|nr:TolC family outer membrane protein [Niveibacterium umoris]MBB4014571.1 adhesin transport system outer membrane protein [Niveibacterium umoris]